VFFSDVFSPTDEFSAKDGFAMPNQPRTTPTATVETNILNILVPFHGRRY
jgi:hypothetical protein